MLLPVHFTPVCIQITRTAAGKSQQVQNGFSDDPNGNEKICGAPGQTKIYYSTHETLKVLFVSDASGPKQYDGFKATYTQLNYSPPSKY